MAGSALIQHDWGPSEKGNLNIDTLALCTRRDRVRLLLAREGQGCWHHRKLGERPGHFSL